MKKNDTDTLTLSADAWQTIEHMAYAMNYEPADVELRALRTILDVLPELREGRKLGEDFPLFALRHLIEFLIANRRDELIAQECVRIDRQSPGLTVDELRRMAIEHLDAETAQ